MASWTRNGTPVLPVMSLAGTPELRVWTERYARSAHLPNRTAVVWLTTSLEVARAVFDDDGNIVTGPSILRDSGGTALHGFYLYSLAAADGVFGFITGGQYSLLDMVLLDADGNHVSTHPLTALQTTGWYYWIYAQAAGGSLWAMWLNGNAQVVYLQRFGATGPLASPVGIDVVHSYDIHAGGGLGMLGDDLLVSWAGGITTRTNPDVGYVNGVFPYTRSALRYLDTPQGMLTIAAGHVFRTACY